MGRVCWHLETGPSLGTGPSKVRLCKRRHNNNYQKQTLDRTVVDSVPASTIFRPVWGIHPKISPPEGLGLRLSSRPGLLFFPWGRTWRIAGVDQDRGGGRGELGLSAALSLTTTLVPTGGIREGSTSHTGAAAST